MRQKDSTKIREMINILRSRIKTIEGKVDITDIQKGNYNQKGFINLLEDALEEINKTQELPHELHTEIRKLFADLTQFEILPSAAAWPRRYFYEKAYYRSWEDPKCRFIYKALDALYKKKGFEQGWEELPLEDVRREVESKFKDFYSIRPSVGWNSKKERFDINQSSLDIGELFIRLFYVEGLAAELLEAWKSYEAFLYLANPHYRDHFLHLIYDFLIGCKLIEGLIERIYKNWKYYTGEDIEVAELRIRLMRSWMIATLFHDIGYAAETLGNFRGALQETFFSKVPGFELSPLILKKEDYLKEEVDDFLTLLSFVFTEDEFSFDFKMVTQYKEKRIYPDSLIFGAINSLFADQIEKMDHGIMSALFLLLTLKIDIHEFTMEADEKVDKKERDEIYRKERSKILEDIVVAALAIALHNMRQTVYKGLTIDFRSHPISFLLMLCDDLHEWDRRHDWNLTSQAFKAIYGFEVFQKLKSPQYLLNEKVRIECIDGDSWETESFFTYLKHRVKAIDGKKGNIYENFRILLPGIQNILKKDRTPEDIKFEIGKWVDCQNVEPKIKMLLKTLSYNITNDVITLTYVGGDERVRGAEEDRVLKLWMTFKRLFLKNLSNGPSICILHGYDEEMVELFFTAEYSPTLKCYKIEESLKPKPY